MPTKRELEVMRELGEGFNLKQIGQNLGVTDHTVKTYIHRLGQKFNVPNHCHPHVILALTWHSELFQVGLKELGLV